MTLWSEGTDDSALNGFFPSLAVVDMTYFTVQNNVRLHVRLKENDGSSQQQQRAEPYFAFYL